MRLVLVMAAVAVATGASAQTSDRCDVPQRKALASAQQACVMAQAERLEPSKETADLVATAAMSACSNEESALRDYLIGCSDVPHGNAVMDAALPYLRAQAIGRVVEIRAARARR